LVHQKQGRTSDSEALQPIGLVAPELASIDQEAQQAARDRHYPQAEDDYRKAIQWIEQNPKARADGRLAVEWSGLGRVLEGEGRDQEAEEAYKKLIAIEESRMNPRIWQSVPGFPVFLVSLYRRQGRINEAEAAGQHALETQEQLLGPDHARVADTLLQLGSLYEQAARTEEAKGTGAAALARYAQAAEVYDRALKIQEKNFGPDSQQLGRVLSGYASVLRKLHADAQAVQLEARLNSLKKR
jgi:tetratricopeptide (TPR) repeat protein